MWQMSDLVDLLSHDHVSWCRKVAILLSRKWNNTGCFRKILEVGLMWILDIFCFTGIEVPEGVDPSFLAALPENIRQEVIADQLRLQRIQQRAQQQQQQLAETPGVMEVNPEFLAALPPNIQEEVRSRWKCVCMCVLLLSVQNNQRSLAILKSGQ